MNMKKTIAALAAGAVAVSAMATTVSALADTTLTYNLVKKYEVKAPKANTATYEFTVQDATAVATELTFTNAKDKVKSVVIKVASSAAGDQNKIYTYSTDKGALNYNANITEDGVIILDKELLGYSQDAKLTLTVTVNTETKYKTDQGMTAIEWINPDLNTVITADSDNGEATNVVLKAYTAGDENKVDEYYAPFKTEIKNNKNITAYLQEGDVKTDKDVKDKAFYDTKVVTAKGQGYHNVGAVLNDAIQNYETVTFTFNTATNGIIWTVENEITKERLFDKYYVANTKYGNADKKDGGNYTAALAAAATPSWANDATLLAYYSSDWFADTSYMSFDQHLYQGTVNPYGSYITSYASENSGYTGFDWTGYNLFQGALVINENLTMSLAETDYFDWTATSLSFDWDAIMDGAMTSNDYAVYLHSMKLATSNTWYWDNMTVTLTAGAADDVEAEAGVEADDEELAEEEVEEEVVEEEVEEEVEVEVEVANPTTGNASVALAVIPVALAAAAVVAKKRS